MYTGFRETEKENNIHGVDSVLSQMTLPHAHEGGPTRGRPDSIERIFSSLNVQTFQPLAKRLVTEIFPISSHCLAAAVHHLFVRSVKMPEVCPSTKKSLKNLAKVTMHKPRVLARIFGEVFGFQSKCFKSAQVCSGLRVAATGPVGGCGWVDRVGGSAFHPSALAGLGIRSPGLRPSRTGAQTQAGGAVESLYIDRASRIGADRPANQYRQWRYSAGPSDSSSQTSPVHSHGGTSWLMGSQMQGNISKGNSIILAAKNLIQQSLQWMCSQARTLCQLHFQALLKGNEKRAHNFLSGFCCSPKVT